MEPRLKSRRQPTRKVTRRHLFPASSQDFGLDNITVTPRGGMISNKGGHPRIDHLLEPKHVIFHTSKRVSNFSLEHVPPWEYYPYAYCRRNHRCTPRDMEFVQRTVAGSVRRAVVWPMTAPPGATLATSVRQRSGPSDRQPASERRPTAAQPPPACYMLLKRIDTLLSLPSPPAPRLLSLDNNIIQMG